MVPLILDCCNIDARNPRILSLIAAITCNFVKVSLTTLCSYYAVGYRSDKKSV